MRIQHVQRLQYCYRKPTHTHPRIKYINKFRGATSPRPENYDRQSFFLIERVPLSRATEFALCLVFTLFFFGLRVGSLRFVPLSLSRSFAHARLRLFPSSPLNSLSPSRSVAAVAETTTLFRRIRAVAIDSSPLLHLFHHFYIHYLLPSSVLCLHSLCSSFPSVVRVCLSVCILTCPYHHHAHVVYLPILRLSAEPLPFFRSKNFICHFGLCVSSHRYLPIFSFALKVCLGLFLYVDRGLIHLFINPID